MFPEGKLELRTWPWLSLLQWQESHGTGQDNNRKWLLHSCYCMVGRAGKGPPRAPWPDLSSQSLVHSPRLQRGGLCVVSPLRTILSFYSIPPQVNPGLWVARPPSGQVQSDSYWSDFQ